MSDVAPAAPAIPLEHARSHAGVPTAALVGTSLWVGSAALACGLLLLRRQTARGPPHPFVSAGVSGLLIGTGCLVVLPEALDSLPAAGWTSAQVLLLFLSAAALMFFLDHAAMEHVHVLAGERVLAAPCRWRGRSGRGPSSRCRSSPRTVNPTRWSRASEGPRPISRT